MLDLRPSGSSIWTNCAASARFGANCPESPEGDAAREGTAAAWVAETVLNGNAISARDLEGETHPNGWLITPDMVDHVQGYVDMVKSRGGVISAETFVRLNEFIAGTLDCSASVMDGTLYIDDLKYGYGVVEPYRNTQLGIYGAARLRDFNNVERVQLGIYQPRAVHHQGIYRTWTITPDELVQFAQWICERGNAAQDLNSVATPGDHCKYCPARSTCEALAHSCYAAFNVVESANQFGLSGDSLAGELDFLERLSNIVEARKNAIEAEAEAKIRDGKFIPGWHLKDRLGRRRIKGNVKPETIRALTGVDPNKSVARSPKELEQAGASVETIKLLSETPVIGWKLERLPHDFFAKQFNETKGK